MGAVCTRSASLAPIPVREREEQQHSSAAQRHLLLPIPARVGVAVTVRELLQAYQRDDRSYLDRMLQTVAEWTCPFWLEFARWEHLDDPVLYSFSPLPLRSLGPVPAEIDCLLPGSEPSVLADVEVRALLFFPRREFTSSRLCTLRTLSQQEGGWALFSLFKSAMLNARGFLANGYGVRLRSGRGGEFNAHLRLSYCEHQKPEESVRDYTTLGHR